MSLRPYRDDVHEYIRRMERAIIAALADVGIEAGPIEGLTGVWTHEPRKIASIGVHVSRGVTTHGFAINVNNDLQPFEWIVPVRHRQLPRHVASRRELQRRVRHGPLHGRRKPRVRRRLRARCPVSEGRP